MHISDPDLTVHFLLPVWKYRAAVIIPLAVLWLLQLALWMLDVISIQVQPALLPAMGHTCTAHDKVFMGGIPFVLTILVDLTASTLIATRLFNRGGEKSKAKKIRRMLVKDALVSSREASQSTQLTH